MNEEIIDKYTRQEYIDNVHNIINHRTDEELNTNEEKVKAINNLLKTAKYLAINIEGQTFPTIEQIMRCFVTPDLYHFLEKRIKGFLGSNTPEYLFKIYALTSSTTEIIYLTQCIYSYITQLRVKTFIPSSKKIREIAILYRNDMYNYCKVTCEHNKYNVTLKDFISMDNSNTIKLLAQFETFEDNVHKKQFEAIKTQVKGNQKTMDEFVDC